MQLFDRVKGMLIGGAYGDAAGVPDEFHRLPPRLEGQFLEFRSRGLVMRRRFQPTVALAPGQYSDDTEMHLSLIYSMIESGGYDRIRAANWYIRWANSETPLRGKNTTMLFKNNSEKKDGPRGVPIKHETYASRFRKAFGVEALAPPFSVTSEAAEMQQSNGALMRCGALALLGHGTRVDVRAILEDVWITNPSKICAIAEIYLVQAIKLAFHHTSPSMIWDSLQTIDIPDIFKDHLEPIRSVFAEVTAGNYRPRYMLKTEVPPDGIHRKGWVLVPFHLAMAALHAISVVENGIPVDEALQKKVIETFPRGCGFNEVITWVVSLGGDTDTNATIVGYLIGAINGFSKMSEDALFRINLDVLMESTLPMSLTTVPRGPEFRLDSDERINYLVTSLIAVANAATYA